MRESGSLSLGGDVLPEHKRNISVDPRTKQSWFLCRAVRFVSVPTGDLWTGQYRGAEVVELDAMFSRRGR